ncbi:hypothetical protein [Cupriavidus sp. DL-D2]|uniref:hypothetical protein n=1 Tax=Cupriavidus sp. DL-D2 TaxID=3144974 RepID=UPI0032149C2A
MRIEIFVGRAHAPICVLTSMAQLAVHRQTLIAPYRIVIDGQLHEAAAAPVTRKPKPCTPWTGSWAYPHLHETAH